MILLGIDIGTSGVKCLALGGDGRVAAKATREVPLETPRPGWAEQDPAWWEQAAFEAIRELLSRPGIRAEDIAGIAFSGQMHGLVPLDREGRVIRKAILWCDQRTGKQCAETEEAAGGREALLGMTNNVMLTGYTGGKLLWLREEEPENFRAMTAFLCPKDYLRYRLTGEIRMDVSEASGTGLFDTRHRAWCETLIGNLALPRSIFPDTVESVDPAGRVTAEAARATGLKEGTPCFAGGGDAVVQSFGSGLIREGTVGTVIGTAGNVSMGFETYRENPGGQLQMFCGVTPGAYMSFGATQTAGGALRWFRDQLAGDVKMRAKAEGRNAFDLMSEMARTSPPGAGGVVFAPYLSGERCPYPDPNARGLFYGMSLSTTREDMIRAVMEGITFSLRQIAGIYEEMMPLKAGVSSGGGAASPLWLQMQADVFGLPIRTVSAASEGGAYGAALVGGVGCGLFKNLTEAVSVIHTETVHQPCRANKEIYARNYRMYRMLYPAAKPMFDVGATFGY